MSNGYLGSDTKGMSGGFVGNPEPLVMIEMSNTIKRDVVIREGFNAGSFGPITIEDGVTITVEDNATWVVV